MKTFGLEGAAEFLNISEATMQEKAASGLVPGAKIGKSWVFTDEALEEYLREEIRQQTATRRLRSSPTTIQFGSIKRRRPPALQPT